MTSLTKDKMRRVKCSVWATVLMMCAMTATAVDIRWVNSSVGDFQTPSNWEPAVVPGTNDVIIFDLDATYTVTWSAPSSIFGFRVNAGDVRWNLQGHTHSLSNYGTNNVGLPSSPATLTVTNGSVSRAGGYTGTSKAFKLQGTGSRLQVLGNGQYLNLYYVKFESGTHVLVDGPGAKLTHMGYSFYLKDSVVVTNGAVWELTGGVKLHDGGDIRIYGGATKHQADFSDIQSGSNVLLADGADVECRSSEEEVIEGTFTLVHATYRYSYKPSTKGEFLVAGTNALLQGTGALKFCFLGIDSATVLPGGRNAVGTLAVTGGITNITPDAGTFEFELAGSASNQYDRVVLYNDGRSVASHGYPDARWHPGGRLTVSLINGYRPAAGDTFDLMDFDSVEGTFDSLDLEGGAGKWDVSQLYVSGEITYIDGSSGDALTVINGTGDGKYTPSTVVLIAAAEPDGLDFVAWTGDTAWVADVHDPTTEFVMPAQNVRVTAVYSGPFSNDAPVVTAGGDQMLDLPTETVYLRGSAADDGNPGPGMTAGWSKVSGPGAVTFGAAALATEARITEAGTYVLRLTANDGDLEACDDLTVLVHDSERLRLPVVYTAIPKATADMAAFTDIYTINLQTFGIYNDGTHPVETSAGINAALQYAKTIPANRIVFPSGTYLISETDPIVLDHQDTIIDLNGAVLQINSNGLVKYAIVKVVDGARNLRLTNGTIRGDRDAHDYAAATGSHEWGHALVLKGGWNLEIDNLTLTKAAGDGLVTEANVWSGPPAYYVYTNNLEQGAFSPLGTVMSSTEKTRTRDPYDVSAYEGAFEFGYTAGYQGFPYVFDRAYQAYFYAEDRTFIARMDCVQYKKLSLPPGTKYVHLEFNQAVVSSPLKYCGFIVNWRPPTHVHCHDNLIVENRRNGLSVCGGQKMIIEDNMFRQNGGTAPGYGVDYEDGWELMQDIIFRRNRFDSNARGDLVVCAGSELIFEENSFEQGYYIWGRTHNAIFRHNQVPAAPGAGKGVTYRTKSGALSIHHNRYENLAVGPKVIYDAADLPTVRLIDESIYNSAMSAGTFVRADVLHDVKIHIYNSTFEDSVIKVVDAESHSNTFVRCSVTDSRWNSHDAHTYTDCVVSNFNTSSHTETDLIEFRGCKLTDVSVDVLHFANQTQMDVIVDDCEVVLNARSLVKVLTDRLDLLQVTHCTIDNNSPDSLVDNRIGEPAAETVVIENNTYLP